MSGRKRPSGEQAVPEWGNYPWMDIRDDDDDVTFLEAAYNITRERFRARYISDPEFRKRMDEELRIRGRSIREII